MAIFTTVSFSSTSTSSRFAVGEYMEEILQEMEDIYTEAYRLVLECSAQLEESWLIDGMPIHVWERFHAEEIYS